MSSTEMAGYEFEMTMNVMMMTDKYPTAIVKCYKVYFISIFIVRRLKYINNFGMTINKRK